MVTIADEPPQEKWRLQAVRGSEVKRGAGQLQTMPNVEVLAKPFDAEALLAKVAYTMDGQFEG